MIDHTVAPLALAIVASANPAPRQRACTECGNLFDVPARGPGGHKRFCNNQCRDDFGNREKGQGATLVSIAKVWRRRRGGGDVGKLAFQQMTAILDLLIARDRGETANGFADRLEDHVAAIMQTSQPIDRIATAGDRKRRAARKAARTA